MLTILCASSVLFISLGRERGFMVNGLGCTSQGGVKKFMVIMHQSREEGWNWILCTFLVKREWNVWCLVHRSRE